MKELIMSFPEWRELKNICLDCNNTNVEITPDGLVKVCLCRIHDSTIIKELLNAERRWYCAVCKKFVFNSHYSCNCPKDHYYCLSLLEDRK